MRVLSLAAVLLMAGTSSLVSPAPAPAVASEPAARQFDWPRWRGPEGNGISRETGLVDSFDPDGENVIWKREDMGTMSTPIVMNGKLYVLLSYKPDTAEEGERIKCVDAATGEDIWERSFNVYLSDAPGERTAWTSSVVGDPETGNVYCLGLCGYFQCLDGETGEVKWSKSLHEEYGLLSTYGGRTNTPLIFEDTVLISGVVIGWGDMARPAHRFMCFDKRTGVMRWFAGTRPLPYDTTYSTPTISVINGTQSLVFGSGDGGVWALQPRTGAQIWKYQLSRSAGLNVSPLVVGDTVYSSHSEENVDDATMGALVAIDATGSGDITKSGELWRIKELVAGKSSPIMVNGYLYVVDDRAKLWIFDRDGKQLGSRPGQPNVKLGSVMRSSPLYADGKLYLCTRGGRFYVLKVNEDGTATPVKRGGIRLSGSNFGSPIVSHGRIYLPMTECLYCIGDGAEPKTDPIPAAPAEAPVADDPKPALVQVVPCEVIVRPGETEKFHVRLFNARGQLLEENPACEFSVEGDGTISDAGELTVNPGNTHEAIFVSAKAGDVTGTARVRVVPPLPWKFDFADGDIPVTWIGMRHRHVIQEHEGNPAMYKLDSIPTPRGETQLGTRSRGWIGQADLHDYTIQADFLSTQKMGRDVADIGLTAQGYTLALLGSNNVLEIRSWATQYRLRKDPANARSDTEFELKPDTWYTMKLQAATEGDKVVVRGKIWPRDSQEPSDWQVTAVDEVPVLHGAPGFFGNARTPASPFYMDNVSVTPNGAASQ